MKGRFRGETYNKVDAKGRVSVPASFRRVLEEGDPDSPKTPTIILVWGAEGGKCIHGYTVAAAADMDALIDAEPSLEKRETMGRLFYSNSADIQIDETGRFVLPAKRKADIGIDDEAVFVGVGHKFEIWSPAAHAAEQARTNAEFASGNTDAVKTVLMMLDEARLLRARSAVDPAA